MLIKGLLASSLIGSALTADIYVGAEYGVISGTNTYSMDGHPDTEYDYDATSLKFKVGAGSDGGVKFHAYYAMINNDDSDDISEVGVELIKEFEVSDSFYPYIKFGLGYGWMDYVSAEEDTINEISYGIGVGLSFKVADSLYIIGGIDYSGRVWQEIEFSGGDLTTTSSELTPYAGLNFAF